MRIRTKHVLAGTTAMALMIIFTPWLYFDGWTSIQHSAGYHFWFSPPAITTYKEMFGLDDDEYFTTRYVRVRLNGLRLIVQLLLAFFLTATFVTRRRDPQDFVIPFTFSIFLTLFLLALMFTKF